MAQKRPRGKSHGPLLFSQQNQLYQKSNDRKEIKKWEMVWRRGNRGWGGDEVRVEEAFFFFFFLEFDVSMRRSPSSIGVDMHIVNREQMRFCILRVPKKRNKSPLPQDQQLAESNRRQV